MHVEPELHTLSGGRRKDFALESGLLSPLPWPGALDVHEVSLPGPQRVVDGGSCARGRRFRGPHPIKVIVDVIGLGIDPRAFAFLEVTVAWI